MILVHVSRLTNVVLFSDLGHNLQSAFRTKAMEVHPDQNQENRGC
jgi:hypothetical protein